MVEAEPATSGRRAGALEGAGETGRLPGRRQGLLLLSERRWQPRRRRLLSRSESVVVI